MFARADSPANVHRDAAVTKKTISCVVKQAAADAASVGIRSIANQLDIVRIA
jgi:hypothetical protein